MMNIVKEDFERFGYAQCQECGADQNIFTVLPAMQTFVCDKCKKRLYKFNAKEMIAWLNRRLNK